MGRIGFQERSQLRGMGRWMEPPRTQRSRRKAINQRHQRRSHTVLLVEDVAHRGRSAGQEGTGFWRVLAHRDDRRWRKGRFTTNLTNLTNGMAVERSRHDAAGAGVYLAPRR